MNLDMYDSGIKKLIDDINLKLDNKDTSSIKITEDLIIMAFSIHDKSLEGYARYLLALCYYRLDYPEEKIREALNKAIIFLTPADERTLISSAYNMLGILEGINNRQNLAMDYFITALSYCDKEGEEYLHRKYIIEANISYLYYSAGEIEYAISLTSDTIDDLSKLTDRGYDFQLLFYNLCCITGIYNCETEEPDIKSAEEYLNKADKCLMDNSLELTPEQNIVHTILLIMLNFMRFNKKAYDFNIQTLLLQIEKIDTFADNFSNVCIVIEFLINHEEYFSAGKIIGAISRQVKTSSFLGIHATFDELMINYLEGSGMEESANEASHRYYRRIREKKPGDVGAMLYSLNLRRDMQRLLAEGEQLKYAAIREKAANEAKTAFLSNMSHELRTPINAVLGMDEMILRETSESNIYEYAENIRTAGNSLLSIINDILDFSKIEAGKLDILPADYYLSSLLNSLRIMLNPKAIDKNLTLEFRIDKDIPDLLYGDEMRIKQILVNLTNNAIKYTKQGGVTLLVSHRKVSDSSIALDFHVKDTGVGIKNEDLERLFAPFERIDLDKNKNIEGTGLGISITTKLLKLMGSELKVDSEYSKGSDFHFSLLQKVTNWEKIGDFNQKSKEHEETHIKKSKSFSAPSARILVVDDTEMNLIVIRNLLKRTNIQIDTAMSGAEALEKIEFNDYNVIFMDHRMPNMDGVETLAHIKNRPEGARNKNTPEVMLTADAIVGMGEKFLSSGFDSYLTKPVNADDLEDVLMKLLPPELVIETDPADKIMADKNLTPVSNEDDAVLKRLKKLDMMDIRSAINACGDVSTFLSIAKNFYESAPAKLMEITEAIENNDIELFTVKVHALKSSARLCGLNLLSKAAERLEDEGNRLKDNGMSLTDSIIFASRDLLSNYEMSASAVGSSLGAENKSGDELKEIDLDELYDAYRIIYEYNEAFDIGSIDEIIKKLESYKIPNSEEKRFLELKAFVNDIDNDGISNILKQIV